MKKAEILTLIGSLSLIAAVVGGLLLWSRLNDGDRSRIAELEGKIAAQYERNEQQAVTIADLSASDTRHDDEMAAMSRELEQARRESERLAQELASSRSAIAAIQEKERDRKAGTSVTPKVTFSDPQGAVTVEILRILTGDAIVKESKLHNLDNFTSQGKEGIYFEIKITNNNFDGELLLSQYRFKLESTSGDTFSVEQTRDYIRGRVHKGRSARGGVAFAVYPDSTPKALRFDTRLKDGLGTALEAVSPDLRALLPQK